MRENPLHKKEKKMNIHLSRDLKEEYGAKKLPVRKGDVVEVARGNFKGRSSEVEEVDLDKGKVLCRDIDIEKKEGSKVKIPLDPSNLTLTSIDTSDEMRKEILERRSS